MNNDEISTEKFLGKAMVHYRHARDKHPYFADGISYSERTGDDIKDPIRAKYADELLAIRRRFVREASEMGCIMAECVLDCEIAEVYSALAHGDTAQAIEECYDAIAVLMRMIDVLEGRQALGKPVPINEYQVQEWGLEKPVYDGTTNGAATKPEKGEMTMSDLYDEPSCVDEPNLVECEHCGEMFDKIDIDGEDICPKCLETSTQCCFCDERILTDDTHFTAPNGMVFCNDKCYEEYLKEVKQNERT